MERVANNSLVFFGNERLATGVTTTAPTLTALINAGYHIKAVVSNYEEGQSRSARGLEIASVAQAHKIPVLLPKNLKECTEQLKSYRASIGVLAAYGKIVPSSVIDIFPAGIINIHPSLLPQYRGPTPIETALLDGISKTGVSVMQLVKEMDAGPVYMQRTLHLRGNETKQELTDSLLSLGKDMVIEVLPKILDGQLAPRSQPHPGRVTFCQKISKQDGLIDWTKPAVQIEREIRAYAGWPGSRTSLGDKEVIVLEAKVSDETGDEPGKAGSVMVRDKQIFVHTLEGMLEITKLKPAGKQEMSAQAFLAGYGRMFNT